MATATRKIVRIDEDRCTGCGECVPSCAEGAIRIVDGKARLVAEDLCDGLGNCLGTCPVDAITIEERPAAEFDEAAVRRHLGGTEKEQQDAKPPAAPPFGGCPGARMRMMGRPGPAKPQAAPTAEAPSQLAHWPVQLTLVPEAGPIWQDADVLIAADCVPFALADFHTRLLAGRSVAVACPKLDDPRPYVEKLTRIFAANAVRSVTVAHMEVPCCFGLMHAVRTALERSGRNDVELHDVTVGIDGRVRREA